jgi:hypothetical protein
MTLAIPTHSRTDSAPAVGCDAWLERPALKLNKIKALASLKINENKSCNS